MTTETSARVKQPHTGNPPSFQYANTPEGLVSVGDALALKKHLLLAGENAHLAREELFHAAGATLVTLPDGRVMRMRLYGWPVAVTLTRPTVVPTNFIFAANGQNDVLRRLRAIWTQALGGQNVVGASPLVTAAHFHSIAGLSPMVVRDCVRHGAKVISGQKTRGPWTFADLEQTESAGPELAAVYVLAAYVYWDYRSPEPTPIAESAARIGLEHLAAGLFGTRSDPAPRVEVGSPGPYHAVLDSAQHMQLSEMVRYATATNKQLDLSNSFHGDTVQLQAALLDEEGDEVHRTQWIYSHLWRGPEHLASLQDALLQAQVQYEKDPPYPDYRRAAGNGAALH